MAHSFLIFDFEGNEEAAQQARHRLEGWRQGFRLDKKLQLKFERKESEAEPTPATVTTAPNKAGKAESKAKSKTRSKSKAGGEAAEAKPEAQASGKVRLIVRLDFSDHEKLSHQRWVERIPSEEPFKSAHPKVVRTGSPDFTATSDLFDTLD